jgi:hypothetical protein
MPRVFLAVLFVLALAGFTDPGGKYTVEFPAGWSEPVQSHENGTVQSFAPEGQKAWCRTNSVELESLVGQTQEQMNSDYATPYDHDTWAGFLIVDPGSFSEADGEVRMSKGRVVQWATLTFKPAVMGEEVKARIAATVMPGHVVNAACFARSADYDRFATVYEAVLTSMKPR